VTASQVVIMPTRMKRTMVTRSRAASDGTPVGGVKRMYTPRLAIAIATRAGPQPVRQAASKTASVSRTKGLGWM